MTDLTLTDLLEQVKRLGGDPDTTVIEVGGSLLGAGSYELERQSGALVVTLLTEDPMPVVEEALTDDARWNTWRQKQNPIPAQVTHRARTGLVAYLNTVVDALR